MWPYSLLWDGTLSISRIFQVYSINGLKHSRMRIEDNKSDNKFHMWKRPCCEFLNANVLQCFTLKYGYLRASFNCFMWTCEETTVNVISEGGGQRRCDKPWRSRDVNSIQLPQQSPPPPHPTRVTRPLPSTLFQHCPNAISETAIKTELKKSQTDTTLSPLHTSYTV